MCKKNFQYILHKQDKCILVGCVPPTLYHVGGGFCQLGLCQGNPLPPVTRMTDRCKKTLPCPKSYTCNMYEKVLVYISRFSVASVSASVSLFITQATTWTCYPLQVDLHSIL